MKYVLLGKLAREWLDRPAERTRLARAKLSDLGIKLETAYYTRASFDFIAIVEVPSPEALLTFTVWYSKAGYGSIEAIAAFTEDEMDRALRDL